MLLQKLLSLSSFLLLLFPLLLQLQLLQVLLLFDPLSHGFRTNSFHFSQFGQTDRFFWFGHFFLFLHLLSIAPIIIVADVFTGQFQMETAFGRPSFTPTSQPLLHFHYQGRLSIDNGGHRSFFGHLVRKPKRGWSYLIGHFLLRNTFHDVHLKSRTGKDIIQSIIGNLKLLLQTDEFRTHAIVKLYILLHNFFVALGQDVIMILLKLLVQNVDLIKLFL